MMRIRKRASLSAILLVMATVTLSGCGNIKSNSGENSVRDGEDYTADIPSLDQFDAGMSKAHFVSVPSSNSDSKTFDANNANKDVTITNNVR